MFDPLNLANQKKHALQLYINGIKAYYICTYVDNIKHPNRINIARYHLQSMDEARTYILEIHKDKSKNFHIYCYEFLEQKSYSHAFVSILGTDSIGYHLKTKTKNHYALYSRIQQKNEKLHTYKYIADPSDFRTTPLLHGYKKDANDNWYILIKKSNGIVKKLNNNKTKRSWEYKQNNQERLLIEIDTTQKDKYFDIFHGIKLERKDIKLIPWLEKNKTNILKELLNGEKSIGHL